MRVRVLRNACARILPWFYPGDQATPLCKKTEELAESAVETPSAFIAAHRRSVSGRHSVLFICVKESTRRRRPLCRPCVPSTALGTRSSTSRGAPLCSLRLKDSGSLRCREELKGPFSSKWVCLYLQNTQEAF